MRWRKDEIRPRLLAFRRYVSRHLRLVVAVLIGVYLLGPDLNVRLQPLGSRLDLKSFALRLYDIDLGVGRVLGFGVDETGGAASEHLVAFGTALLALSTGWLAWQTKATSEEERRSRRAEAMREWALEIREHALKAGGLGTLYLGRLVAIHKGESVSDEMHERRWDALFNFVDETQHRLAHLMRLHEDIVPLAARVSFLTTMITLEMHPDDEAAFAAALTEYRNALPGLFALIDPLITDLSPSV